MGKSNLSIEKKGQKRGKPRIAEAQEERRNETLVDKWYRKEVVGGIIGRKERIEKFEADMKERDLFLAKERKARKRERTPGTKEFKALQDSKKEDAERTEINEYIRREHLKEMWTEKKQEDAKDKAWQLKNPGKNLKLRKRKKPKFRGKGLRLPDVAPDAEWEEA